jgi:hypothetical protein
VAKQLAKYRVPGLEKRVSSAYAKWKIGVDAKEHGSYNRSGFGPELSVQTHDRSVSEGNGEPLQGASGFLPAEVRIKRMKRKR